MIIHTSRFWHSNSLDQKNETHCTTVHEYYNLKVTFLDRWQPDHVCTPTMFHSTDIKLNQINYFSKSINWYTDRCLVSNISAYKPLLSMCVLRYCSSFSCCFACYGCSKAQDTSSMFSEKYVIVLWFQWSVKSMLFDKFATARNNGTTIQKRTVRTS